MHKFPIGIDDYKELIEKQYIHVDKTSLIQEWWESGPQVAVVTRPRRFGKTISLSMIKYFFENTKESYRHLFEQTAIWQKEEFHRLQGTYPVIFLSFKDIKATTWEAAYQKISDLLLDEIERVISPFAKNLEGIWKSRYQKLTAENIGDVTLSSALKWMTHMLYNQYGKNTIILIDEYDTPITYAYMHEYYQMMTDFMRDLLSSGLKGNPHLEKAFLTGIVRTAKDGILSGLNNPHICTMLNWEFADKFGFTQEEVDSLLGLTDRNLKQEEAKQWYNGYVVGVKYAKDAELSHLCCHVYNPWSILQYLQSGGFAEAYWVKTGSTALLQRLIRSADSHTKEELTLLLQGKCLERKRINTDVILLDLNRQGIEPWSFLFFAGYITATSHVFEENKHWYTLDIPNKEITELYATLVLNTLDDTYTSKKLHELLESLVIGNCEKFTLLFQEFLLKLCSYHDLPSSSVENSLHLFTLGLLASFSERYVIKSNLESGLGRYDIVMIPQKEKDLAILIEFKQGKEEDLVLLATKALEQIEKGRYDRQIRDFGYTKDILLYGIAICGKQVVIQKKQTSATA